MQNQMLQSTMRYQQIQMQLRQSTRTSRQEQTQYETPQLALIVNQAPVQYPRGKKGGARARLQRKKMHQPRRKGTGLDHLFQGHLYQQGDRRT